MFEVMLSEGSTNKQIANLLINMPKEYKKEIVEFDDNGAPSTLVAFALSKIEKGQAPDNLLSALCRLLIGFRAKSES